MPLAAAPASTAACPSAGSPTTTSGIASERERRMAQASRTRSTFLLPHCPKASAYSGPAGRRGGQREDVVRAQLRHRDPAGAQEGVCGQQVVVRPLRDAHDRVRLPVPDAIADPAEQAPPEAELLRP